MFFYLQDLWATVSPEFYTGPGVKEALKLHRRIGENKTNYLASTIQNLKLKIRITN